MVLCIRLIVKAFLTIREIINNRMPCTSVMDTTDDASAVAVAEPMMTEDGLVNFPNEDVKVNMISKKIQIL